MLSFSYYMFSTVCITNLFLEDCPFCVFYDNEMRYCTYPSNDMPNLYMFMYYFRLERLSIKNAMWRSVSMNDPKSFSEYQSVSQEMLIKMVRNHSTLPWLRSDLTKENVAMLPTGATGNHLCE